MYVYIYIYIYTLLLLLLLYTVRHNISALKCYAVSYSRGVLYDTNTMQFPPGNPEHKTDDQINTRNYSIAVSNDSPNS
jgi:hypothetical protein